MRLVKADRNNVSLGEILSKSSSEMVFGNELSFVIPEWCNIREGNYKSLAKEYDKLSLAELSWIDTMFFLDSRYKGLIRKGRTPQEAMSILPLSIKTEITVRK